MRCGLIRLEFESKLCVNGPDSRGVELDAGYRGPTRARLRERRCCLPSSHPRAGRMGCGLFRAGRPADSIVVHGVESRP